MTVEAYVLRDGEGETIPGPAGGPSTIKATTLSTGGTFTLVEIVIGPKQGPPKHLHRREDEMWYVLEGGFRFIAGERIFEAHEKSFVFVPRGTAHCFQNLDDTDSQILIMFTPSGMERFFSEHAEMGPGNVDPQRYQEIAERSWMEVVGPPLAVSHPLSDHPSPPAIGSA